VTIFDAGEEHDLAYIAMEFLKGKDLVDFCKDGNLLPVPKVLSIVARVAEALAYAHRQNVVHRDIKPANIMYELDSDTVKVTDFGIARITDSSKTKTGLVLGTPSFMSPEQIAGKKVDGRSDLYSLGVMLFQMLTGVLPFRGDSMAELMYKIANEEAPDIRIIRKDMPERLANLVAVVWPSARDRYQDGDQFAADLRAARENNEDSVTIDEPTRLGILADGMGGYNAGEIASGMATAFIKSELGRWLSQAGRHANAKEVRRAMEICVDNATAPSSMPPTPTPSTAAWARRWSWASSRTPADAGPYRRFAVLPAARR
jgi:serine/threonine protein kinase